MAQQQTTTATSKRTLEMAFIAIFVVLIAICSWISIPTTVPFTLQTFAVSMTVLMLGGRRGTIALAVYILLAAILLVMAVLIAGRFMRSIFKSSAMGAYREEA